MFISGVVALTLSPMMASRLLHGDRERGWFGRGVDRAFEAIRRAYVRALDVTLGMRPVVYVVWIVLTLLVIPLYLLVAQGARADRGSGRDLRRDRGAAERQPRAGHDLRGPGHRRVQVHTGVPAQLPAHVPEPGLRRDDRRRRGKIASARSSRSSSRSTPSSRGSPGSGPRCSCRPRCRARGCSRSSSCIASTASHDRAGRVRRSAGAGGGRRAVSSRSRRSSMSASISRRPSSSSTATRWRRWARRWSRSGATSAAILGGDFVNRFSLDGRELQGDRADRARSAG